MSRQFAEKGELFISGKRKVESIKGKEVKEIKPLDEEEFELALMETNADDYSIEEGVARVVTSREDFMSTVHTLEKDNRAIEQSDLAYIAENTISLDEAGWEKLERLIEILEDDEDVDTIWHNAA